MEKNTKILEEQLIKNIESLIEDEMILNSFIRGFKVISCDKEKIIISVKSNEIKETIEKHYYEKFKKAIENIKGKEIKIKFILKTEEHLYKKQEINLKTKINSKFTFESYVVSSFNNEVVSIAKGVIKDLGKYSPFYISSKSGLGKTHLLHAIQNKLIEKGKKTHYIEPNDFTNKITKLSKKNSMEISKYIEELKNYDALLFDDIQNMGDRSVTLKVLLQIINHFNEKEKQIIIASDKVAQELSGFEPRFITRFESGMSSQIKELSVEDVSKVLIQKLKEKNIDIDKWDNEAIEFVSRNNKSSIRMLEGAIKRICFFTEGERSKKYTYALISNIFKTLKIDKNELTPSRIINYVAKYYRINKIDITGKSRKKDLVLPRHIAIYLVRKITALSQKEIGKKFGNRDHSTIINAIKKIDQKIKLKDDSIKLALQKIEQKIKTIN